MGLLPVKGARHVETALATGLYRDSRVGWRGALSSLFDYCVRAMQAPTTLRYRPDYYVGGDYGTPAHPVGTIVGDESPGGIPNGKPAGRWIYRSSPKYLGDYWSQPLAPFVTYAGTQIALPLPPANTPQIRRTFALSSTPGNPNLNIHGYDIPFPEAPA